MQNILAVAPPIHPANAQFAEVFGRNNVVELQCSIHFKKHCNFFFLSGPTTCAVSSEFGLAKYFLQRYGELYEVFLQSCLSSELVVLFCPFLAISNVLAAKEVCENFVEELEHVYKWNIRSTSLFFSNMSNITIVCFYMLGISRHGNMKYLIYIICLIVIATSAP